MFADIFFDCSKADCADVVLNFAGVFGGGFFIYAKLLQPAGQKFMSFIYFLSNFPSGIGQIDKSGISYSNAAVFMATLTLDFLKPSSPAMSTERTTGRVLLKTSIVSK